MNANFFRNIALAALIAVTVSACGGGGGDTVASGGTGGTGISSGAVTGFGSIFVNGVEFSTNGASITRDDNSIFESELRKGMVVEVQGSFASSTSGSATTVTVKEAVRGPVQSKTGTPSAGATLVVLGQTVRVDDATLIDNNVCDGIEPCGTVGERFTAIDLSDAFGSSVLEVHGQRTDDGSIVATFIEKSAAAVYVVRGTVAGHNDGTKSFTIGALTVNYGGVGIIINDMPAPSGSNWNDLVVEVKGQNCLSLPVCGTLTATKVEPEGLGLADADQAEVEGFVTTFTSTSNFKIGAQQVLTTGSTIFLGGDQNEIARGVKLEVEGSLAGGVLTATKVKFKDSVKIESNATANASTITLGGLPNITVTANAFTEIKNHSGGATTSDLTNLTGRNVRIRGRASGPNSVIATEIEDKGPADNSDVRLQGFATATSNPTFVILGVQVNTSGLSDPAAFKGVDDAAIGSAAFYSAITPNGGLVKARGNMAAGNALDSTNLKEVELED